MNRKFKPHKLKTIQYYVTAVYHSTSVDNYSNITFLWYNLTLLALKMDI